MYVHMCVEHTCMYVHIHTVLVEPQRLIREPSSTTLLYSLN